MCRAADVLQLGQTGQYGHQKLQHFRLWAMLSFLLMQRHCLKGFHQPNLLGEQAPDDQHGGLVLIVDGLAGVMIF
jgi:hypothetical protein